MNEIKNDPPKKPILRFIQEGNEYPTCEKCGSSLKKRFYFFGKVFGCIQPECVNYWKCKNGS